MPTHARAAPDRAPPDAIPPEFAPYLPAALADVNVPAYVLDATGRVRWLNAAATEYLDSTLDRLTRYFIMLDRVSRQRRKELPDRLAQVMMQVIDDRKLDLELATYILARRRALGSGDNS